MKYRTKTVDVRLTLFGVFLIFYAQKLSFLRRHCVTDSAKISSRFTDRGPIFIDASVKGSDFAKCSACSLSSTSHQSKLPTRFVSGYSHHKQAIVMHTQKNRIRFAIDCKSSGFSI